MKEIPATKGFVILVDDEDFERLAASRWHARIHHSQGYRPGRVVCLGSRRGGGKQRQRVVHPSHEIMKPPEGYVVDHINGDPWDNRRANLRICTAAENSRNRKPNRQRPVQYKGVLLRENGRFGARIAFEKREYRLGSFATPEEAARAYDAAAIRLHGEFARLNFPPIAASGFARGGVV